MSTASLLELCHGEKKYVILNKQVKFLTSQYIGTCKSAYTKGYALNWALTSIINEYGLFRLNRRFALSQ